MASMFSGAKSFNRDISMWKVSRVTTMEHMFYDATSFNSDISKWDVSHVFNMDWMLYRTVAFARIICGTAWARSKATKDHVFTRSSGRFCFGCDNLIAALRSTRDPS